MGVFNDLLARPEKSRAEKLLNYFKSNQEIENRDEFINILNTVVKKDGIDSILPEDILCTVISEVHRHNSDPEKIISAKFFYNLIVYDDENKEQVELFHKFFNLFLENKNVFRDLDDFYVVYNSFKNKKLVLGLYGYIVRNSTEDVSTYDIIRYIREARKYYVDEEAFYSSVIKVAEKACSYRVKDDIRDFVNTILTEDKNAAGIYDIDKERILELAENVKDIERNIINTDNLCEGLKSYCENLQDEISRLTERIVSSKIHEISAAQKDLLVLIKDFTVKTKNLMESYNSEIESKGEFYLKKMQDLLGLKPEKEDELKEKLKSSISFEVHSDILDVNLTLKEKRAKAQNRMNALGENYHETFPRILKYVLYGKPVMLVGPSGSGKTYTVEQIARLLNIPLYNFGFIADEFATIKGFNDVNGNFVNTPFYNCFKYGGICFFDEADNSEARAFEEINKVIGSSGYVPYLFQNGEIVKPHPYFIIIATANTWGEGADTLYSTREKLDGSTLNRFERIYYDYDKKIEKKIMTNYSDIYDFAIAYRSVTSNRKMDKIISTRDLSDIKGYLDTGEFSLEEVIETKFINGMRRDSLESILLDIDTRISSSNKALQIAKTIAEGKKVLVK